MKRLHLHINVDNIDRSVQYYSALLGAEPTKREQDYAKWLLDDPAVNIAISDHRKDYGVDHAGISLDSTEELETVASRLRKVEAPLQQQEDATCCYAKSNKYWSTDPEGAVWELFHTFGDAATYGESGENPQHAQQEPQACCAPEA